MLGNTGTIYYRKTHAWKGELILMMARGGWINTVHGNLEFLTDEDERWFAKVQELYLRLESVGRTKTFGGIPGEAQFFCCLGRLPELASWVEPIHHVPLHPGS